MNILGGVTTEAPHHDSLAVVLPLENRPWPDAELATNLGWHRNLTLGGDLRFNKRHVDILPR